MESALLHAPPMKSAFLTVASIAGLALGASSQTFVNWETPHVHPLDLTPAGTRLLAVNTPDDRLEVFDASGPDLVRLPAIPVGIDPVSVRARGETEAWVVNHVSDSISIVDLVTGRVRATLQTEDEPCDVVFAGDPERAFVTCSQVNTVLVFDPADLDAAPTEIAIDGEDPRALAVSNDGMTVYAAIYESGNATTILGGRPTNSTPPDVVSDPLGPHGGLNPFPNAGANWDPSLNTDLPPPPKVDLIVRKDDQDRWLDDIGGDWTQLVSGSLAANSGRPVGWDMPDRDVAVIATDTLAVMYLTRLMNINMAIAVRADDSVTVVGTDATNERRFEANNNGTFVRALMADVGQAKAVHDLNPHLSYTVTQAPQALRDLSIGDPRGIAWRSDGAVGYVTGMGSNNLILVDGSGNRLSTPIEVGEGPTGIVLHEPSSRAFVLNKFDSSISVVDTVLEVENERVPFYDPSPDAIKVGRKHLYDTHATSGLGQVSCASCHVDARMDRLAWDLGDPSGPMGDLVGQNLGANLPVLQIDGFTPPHPMKGPMTTQTLQDIIGLEPLHWRGDKSGIEEFNPAFVNLQGDDTLLTATEMQELEDFLATIHFPPNPNRNLDNTLPTDLPLPGHFTTGAFGPAGQPLPNGNAQSAFDNLYQPPHIFAQGVSCITCHTVPSGTGSNWTWNGVGFDPLPLGPDGESHLTVVELLGNDFASKVPQLRNMHEKTGFNLTQLENNAGFGYRTSGVDDSLERFLSRNIFELANDQEVADLVAFMLSFAGGDLTGSDGSEELRPPSSPSKDTHAAVGAQATLGSGLQPTGPSVAELIAIADTSSVGLVAKSLQNDEARGYVYTGASSWQSDRSAEVETTASLESKAAAGAEITYTVVPLGTQNRIGIDRDGDGYFDRDELDAASDPQDPGSVPGPCVESLPSAPTGLGVTTVGATSLRLDWTDTSTTEMFFVVERALKGGTFGVVTQLPADTTHFTDIGLAVDQDFEYRIVARNCAGDAVSVPAPGGTGTLLSSDTDTVSIAGSGSQVLTLEAGVAHANEVYMLLGSASGTSPGVPTPAGVLPLAFDAYTNITLASPNSVILSGSFSTLDATGGAQAVFTLPPGMNPALAGAVIHHAFVTIVVGDTIYSVSNAVPALLVP